MILAPRFVFFHTPRTGGTWLKKQLRAHAPPEWGCEFVTSSEASRFATNQHWDSATLARLRPDRARTPRFAFVRNPWDLYVSLFEHWKRWNITRAFEPYLEHMVSHRTTLTAWMEDAAPADVGLYERLREDSFWILKKYSDSMPRALEEAFRDSCPENGALRLPYQQYYSPRTRALVASADREIIRRYRYEF